MANECKDCKHVTQTEEVYLLKCRRYPPLVPAGSSLARHPRVKADDTCGEFEVEEASK